MGLEYNTLVQIIIYLIGSIISLITAIEVWGRPVTLRDKIKAYLMATLSSWLFLLVIYLGERDETKD